MFAWLLERWLESFTDKSLILLNPSLEANGDSFHLPGFFCDLWPKASVRSHLPGWVVLYRRAAPRWRLCVCALMHKIMWIKLEKCGSLSRAVEPIFNNPQCTFFLLISASLHLKSAAALLSSICLPDAPRVTRHHPSPSGLQKITLQERRRS